MGKILTGAVCVVAAVSLSACGSSKSSTTPSPSASSHSQTSTQLATASLRDELLLQSSTTASPLTFSSSQAECTARQVIAAVGVDMLRTYGLLNTQYQATAKTLDQVTLSRADATSVVNAFIACLGQNNFAQAMSRAVTSSITGAHTAAQHSCLMGKLTVAALKPMLIDSLSGNRQAATQFYAGLLTCTKK